MRATRLTFYTFIDTFQIIQMPLSRSLASSIGRSISTTHDCTKWNKKISHLIRTGQIEAAKNIFDAMEHKSIVSWNAIITGYVKRREIVKARKLFDEMPERDIVSWNLMISGYMSFRGLKFVEEGKLLFDQIPDKDLISWNTMITGYLRNGMVRDALLIFDSMVDKDIVTWNAMVTGFLQNGDVKRAIEFFKTMPERDSASLCSIVSGLINNGEIRTAENLLFEFEAKEGNGHYLLNGYNTLIAGYSQEGHVHEARRIFDLIPHRGYKNGFEKNIVSWNTMIMCYVKSGDLNSARELFNQMVDRDIVTWNTMINGYVQVLNMEEALNLFNKMLYKDILTWNSMITGFAEAGNLGSAYEFFQTMPRRNLISWNSIISGFEKNSDYKMAINLYLEMQSIAMKPDQHTLCSLLTASAGSVNLLLGKQIHQQVLKSVIGDIPMNNAIITMYSKCGAIQEALTVFNEMKSKDVISWNAMIAGYASHGIATKALKLFEEMKLLELKPTYITFISVLSACAHGGFTAAGRHYFDSMTSHFSISPGMEHFSSLVDIIGRNGELKEAIDIIKNMPFRPDKSVWGALLGACRVHNNVFYGRLAAEELMLLEPESSAPYVLMYQIYSDVGLLNDAAEMKVLMRRNNVGKHVGASWFGSLNTVTTSF